MCPLLRQRGACGPRPLTFRRSHTCTNRPPIWAKLLTQNAIIFLFWIIFHDHTLLQKRTIRIPISEVEMCSSPVESNARTFGRWVGVLKSPRPRMHRAPARRRLARQRYTSPYAPERKSREIKSKTCLGLYGRWQSNRQTKGGFRRRGWACGRARITPRKHTTHRRKKRGGKFGDGL